MSGEPDFFEIGVQDADRGKRFYGQRFNWDLAPGPSGEGFAISHDSDAAEYGRFKLCKDDQGSPFGLHEPPPSTPA